MRKILVEKLLISKVDFELSQKLQRSVRPLLHTFLIYSISVKMKIND